MAMRKTTMALGLAMVLAAAASFAGPGYSAAYGMGYGPGNGPCATGGTANCSGPDAGYGPGYGRGRMGGGYGPGGAGALMSDEEREAHRNAMHSFTTVEQCNAYWTDHRAQMTERAKAQGIEPGPGPRFSPCERMAARGFLK
jgi:hypothetical protein